MTGEIGERTGKIKTRTESKRTKRGRLERRNRERRGGTKIRRRKKRRTDKGSAQGRKEIDRSRKRKETDLNRKNKDLPKSPREENTLQAGGTREKRGGMTQGDRTDHANRHIESVLMIKIAEVETAKGRTNTSDGESKPSSDSTVLQRATRVTCQMTLKKWTSSIRWRHRSNLSHPKPTVSSILEIYRPILPPTNLCKCSTLPSRKWKSTAKRMAIRSWVLGLAPMGLDITPLFSLELRRRQLQAWP